MAELKPPVKRRLHEYLAARGPGAVSEADWTEILRRFAPASPSYLRRLLRESGLPLAPLVEGVRQGSFEDLERTLLAIEHEYSAADSPRRDACRRAVIEAKDHARLALRRAPPDRRADRDEMIRWMLVWLENPAAFPAWLRLRRKRICRKALETQPSAADEAVE